MLFIESPRFPIDIGYGSHGGFIFKTEMVEYFNGAVYRNSRWSSPLMKANIQNYLKKDQSKIATVIAFFNACKGMANGFRVKDYLDFTSASDGISAPTNLDQLIGTGNGATTQYQLIKTYTQGSLTTSRTIQKPVTSTVLISLNGVSQTEGSNFTVDYTTGIVTFTGVVGNGVLVKAGYKFDVPCRFDIDELADIEYIVNRGDATKNVILIPDIPIVELRNP